jgi:hypothetical protein
MRSCLIRVDRSCLVVVHHEPANQEVVAMVARSDNVVALAGQLSRVARRHDEKRAPFSSVRSGQADVGEGPLPVVIHHAHSGPRRDVEDDRAVTTHVESGHRIDRRGVSCQNERLAIQEVVEDHDVVGVCAQIAFQSGLYSLERDRRVAPQEALHGPLEIQFIIDLFRRVSGREFALEGQLADARADGLGVARLASFRRAHDGDGRHDDQRKYAKDRANISCHG